MELEITTRFAALSHPHRLSIFRLLMRRCPDALAAGEIARVLDFKASTTSVYLSALCDAGLIVRERHGTSLQYRANLGMARTLVSEVFLDCCNGRPDLCPPELANGNFLVTYDFTIENMGGSAFCDIDLIGYVNCREYIKHSRNLKYIRHFTKAD